MRIGFDIRPIFKANSRNRGIGRYTRQLIEALLQTVENDQFVLYSFGEHLLDKRAVSETRTLIHLQRPSRLNWILDLQTLPRAIRQDNLDLFHATEITSIPARKSVPVVATVHDLIPFIFWDQTAASLPADFRAALLLAKKRVLTCDLILTDSLHSRQDICERFDLAESRVKVVYPGRDEDLRPADPEEARELVGRKYGVRGPFLFYVGGSDYRKNLPALVEAFARIRSQYGLRLVMAGETFRWSIPETKALHRRIADLDLGEWIDFPGFVAQEDLRFFYSACDLFVFPSLYEGFGLPVLEAMQCGAAVITSDRSSIPEVAGDAAVYFDPAHSESIVEAFQKLYDQPELIRELREKGFQQAARFDWRESAKKIYQYYAGIS